MGCRVSYVPLGELAEFESGGTPSKKIESYWHGSIPWISAKTLVGDTVYESDLTISKEGLESGSKLAPKGSLLLLTRGSGLFKRIPLAIAEKQVAYNQDIKCINSNAKGISNRSLFYALKAIEPAISAMLETTGIGAGKLATDRLKALPIPVLAEDARAKVTSIADCIYGKISLNAQLNGYLLEMAKVIYRQWFVGGTAKYPTTTMKLSDIATINAGGDKPKDVSQTIQPGFCVPIYSNGTDNEGLYGFTSVAKINEPSVTVSARGTIGFTCLRRRPYYPIVRLISATPKRCVTAEYLYLWLLNTSVVGVGTTQQQLTVPMFKAYDIKVPEAKAIERFSQTINPLFDAIDSNKEECIKLAALRDVLLPRLMSGEIDVRKVAIGCGLLH